MKRKIFIIVVITFLILFILGIASSYYDNARVRNNMEPKFTIKMINESGNKVTYFGLGYKVIRYVGVSPNEPFKNNIGVKYGSWFMKYEIEKNVIDNPNEIPTTVAYANWIDSEVAFEGDEKCLNIGKYVFSDFPRLPTFKFDTKSELDDFKNKYKDVFTMDHGYDEVASFNDVTSSYDDEFFSKHSLILTYKEASSGSFRYGISEVKKENGVLVLKVTKTNNPEVYTADMSGWFLMAEVEKEYIRDCKEFDTQIWENFTGNVDTFDINEIEINNELNDFYYTNDGMLENSDN